MSQGILGVRQELTFSLLLADQESIGGYIENRRKMRDVLDLSLSRALNQIPEEEASDHVWPYET